jgi:hypothetical protein
VSDNAGPLLLRAGLITEEQHRAALAASARPPGRTVVEALVASGAVDEDRLCRFFHERLLVPVVGATELTRVSRRALRLIPAEMAALLRCVPLQVDGHRNLVLALADPSDTHAVDEVQFHTGLNVLRVAAPASALAWALHDLYHVSTPLALPPEDSEPITLVARSARRPRTLPPAEIVDDVYAEDTPIPHPVPFDETTGRIVLIDPRSLAQRLVAHDAPPATEPAIEAALREAARALAAAEERDEIAAALVGFGQISYRRAAFFVVRRGQIAGWQGTGHGVRSAALREAVLPLDRPSTFRDLVLTRLPYRGPVPDAPSRDFLIEGLGWAPATMLAVPLAVQERVVGILYGDEEMDPVPDEVIAALARAAEHAFERVLLLRKGTLP